MVTLKGITLEWHPCRNYISDEIPDHHISAVFRRNLFLVLKETLNNIVRHSNANCISIIAQFKDNDLELIIEDNGNGFNLNNYQSDGDGLLNMHKRIQEIGGTFSLESKIGNGTVVNIKVPCFSIKHLTMIMLVIASCFYY